MNANRNPRCRPRRLGGRRQRRDGAARLGAGADAAYTLIELLVVIAIIGVLAGLVLAVIPGLKDQRTRKLVATQLTQIASAIQRYHDDKGFYPAAKANQTALNALYYELVGFTHDGSANVRTLDGRVPSSQVNNTVSQLTNVFGHVLINSAGPGDDAGEVQNFLPALKNGQVRERNGVLLLVLPAKGPDGDACFWNYRVPGVFNPAGFDLWVDLTIRSKTETFGNWKK